MGSRTAGLEDANHCASPSAAVLTIRRNITIEHQYLFPISHVSLYPDNHSSTAILCDLSAFHRKIGDASWPDREQEVELMCPDPGKTSMRIHGDSGELTHPFGVQFVQVFMSSCRSLKKKHARQYSLSPYDGARTDIVLLPDPQTAWTVPECRQLASFG